MFNPATNILETFVICYGDKPGQWFHQLKTLELAQAWIEKGIDKGAYMMDECHIEKWTWRRHSQGDTLLKKERVAL